MLAERVDHQIPDQMDAFGRHSFPEQILDAAPFRNEKHIGNRIGDQPVDLFGHGPVEAPQASFRVNNVDAQFLGDEAPATVEFTSPTTMTPRGDPPEDGLQTPHDFGGLLGVTASAGP